MLNLKNPIKLFIFVFFSFSTIQGQGFNIFALDKFSGGLTVAQREDLNLAKWYQDIANEDKKAYNDLDREMRQQNLEDEKKKLEKLEAKRNTIKLSELNNLGEANSLYFDVYKEILTKLKKDVKPKDSLYNLIYEEEKKGETLIKEALRSRDKTMNISIEEEVNILNEVISNENKGLKILLLAMEGYYNIIHKIEFDWDAMLEQAFTTANLNPEENTSDDEMIIITKDALLHYTDRIEIHSLILEHFNVDTIDNPIYISLSELKTLPKSNQIPVNQNDDEALILSFEDISEKDSTNNVNIPSIVTQYEEDLTMPKPVSISINSDRIDDVELIKKETIVELDKIQEPIIGKPVNDIYYTVQILARKTPITKAGLKIHYPKLDKIKIIQEDGWYKYQVGIFYEKHKAVDYCKNLKLKNSFVAKYKDNKRLSIVYVYE